MPVGIVQKESYLLMPYRTPHYLPPDVASFAYFHRRGIYFVRKYFSTYIHQRKWSFHRAFIELLLSCWRSMDLRITSLSQNYYHQRLILPSVYGLERINVLGEYLRLHLPLHAFFLIVVLTTRPWAETDTIRFYLSRAMLEELDMGISPKPSPIVL